MRRSLVVFTALVSLAVAGCQRDPLSGTHEVVARTVGRDLTVPQMSRLLGNAKARIEMTPDNGVIVANLWSSYQRLAFAAAHGDTLESHLSAAITPTLNNERVTRLLDALRRPFHGDTATEAGYDAASYGLYAVRHILFAYPLNATPKQRDSVSAAASALRPSITAANFGQMAKRYSADRQSAAKGGYLGVFPKEAMNPAVAVIVAELQPGSVSSLVQTPFGVDIIQRLSWAEARPEYLPAFSQAVKQANDSVLSEQMARAVNLRVTELGPVAARDAASNPVKGSRDTTTIATFDKGGRFTAADLLGWVNLMLPLQRVQVLKSLPRESDEVTTSFIRNLAIRGVLLRAADSAGIAVPESVKVVFRDEFLKDVVRSWRALGVAPDQLADSANTPAEREQLAARRADRFIERGMAGEVQLAPVSVPVEAALDAKYETVISSAALERALDAGAAIRAAADSARATSPAANPTAAKRPTGN
jgi:hypothetical protein